MARVLKTACSVLATQLHHAVESRRVNPALQPSPTSPVSVHPLVSHAKSGPVPGIRIDFATWSSSCRPSRVGATRDPSQPAAVHALKFSAPWQTRGWGTWIRAWTQWRWGMPRDANDSPPSSISSTGWSGPRSTRSLLSRQRAATRDRSAYSAVLCAGSNCRASLLSRIPLAPGRFA